MEETQTNTQVPVMQEVQSNSAANMNMPSGKYPRMASFSDRLVAFIIDAVIVAAVSFPLNLGLGFTMGMTSFFSGARGGSFTGSWAIGSFIGLALQFGYFGWFDVNKGQTLGKMAMKIKVVRSADLKYVSWGEAFVREILGRIVDGLALYLGYLWYFMSPKRQAWHDTIGSTYVVKTDAKGDLLMDGPAEYAKEPLKTFGCCAIFGLVFAAIVGLLIYAFAMVASEMNKNGGIQNTQYKTNSQQQFNYNDGTGSSGDTNSMTEEDMQKYLDEINKQMDQNSGDTKTPAAQPL